MWEIFIIAPNTVFFFLKKLNLSNIKDIYFVIPWDFASHRTHLMRKVEVGSLIFHISAGKTQAGVYN